MKEGNRPRNMRSTKNGSLCTGHFPEPALLKHPSQTRLGRQNLMDFLGKSELLEQWSSLEVFAPPCVLCCQSSCENGIGTKSRMISSTSAPCLCPELRAGGECWIWWQGQTPGLVLGTVPRAPSLCCPPLPSPIPTSSPSRCALCLCLGPQSYLQIFTNPVAALRGQARGHMSPPALYRQKIFQGNHQPTSVSTRSCVFHGCLCSIFFSSFCELKIHSSQWRMAVGMGDTLISVLLVAYSKLSSFFGVEEEKK